MNNKFVNLLADARILEKQLGHFSPYATILNEEIAKKFPDSLRTGQCSSFIYLPHISVNAHHIVEGYIDHKLRYMRAGQNKLIFLLEHEERMSTTPKNTEEKEQFEKNSVWRGGIRLYDGPIITTSGFHPVVDEAFSLNLGLVYQGYNRNEVRERWMKDRALEFQNPYALALASLVNAISTVKYNDAMEWGLKEIGENFL